MIASVPSMAICDFESFRSKRVLTSFIACCMALPTSARSILLTISKLLSGMRCHRHNYDSRKRIDSHAEGRMLEETEPHGPIPQTCTHEGNRRGNICAGKKSDLHGQSRLTNC